MAPTPSRACPPASTRVEASAISQGLVREYYNETADRTNTDAVTVSSNADATGINFTLAAGSTISGTVTKADGTAVENADVRAELYDSGGGGAVTTTAADGTYSISGLDADDYRVSASADDQSLVAEFYNDTTDREQASRVTVTATSDTSNVDFALDTAGGISGTVVTDGDSTPIANADVQAERFSCCGPGGSAITASDGTYTITGLAPASYRVHVEVPQEDLAGEFYNDTTDWSEADAVAVAADQTTTGVDFSLATGGSISGSVTKSDGTSPAGDVFVHASEYDTGEYIAGANVAADGTYAIEGLPSGDYRVGTWSAAELGFAQEFYNNRTDWDDADRVTVTAGVETTDIDFTPDDGGSITGVVQTESGTPVEDAEVWAETYDCCGGGNGARTASDGTYTITGLGTGDYRVQVHAPDQGLVTEFYNNTSSWEDADRVAVTAGATTADIDFSVGAGCRWSAKMSG